MCAKYTVILLIYYLYIKKFSYIQKTFYKKHDISKAKRQITKWKEIFTNYSVDKESMYTAESKKKSKLLQHIRNGQGYESTQCAKK